MPRSSERFDLHERAVVFGEAVIASCKRAEGGDVDRVPVRQRVRSGTSIGANYCEANNAESRADFLHKIGLSRKEADETRYWVRMIVAARPDLRDAAVPLWQEAKELQLIFSKIRRGPG